MASSKATPEWFNDRLFDIQRQAGRADVLLVLIQEKVEDHSLEGNRLEHLIDAAQEYAEAAIGLIEQLLEDADGAVYTASETEQ